MKVRVTFVISVVNKPLVQRMLLPAEMSQIIVQSEKAVGTGLRITLEFSSQAFRSASSTCNFAVVSKLMSCFCTRVLMSFLDNESAVSFKFLLINWTSMVNCEI